MSFRGKNVLVTGAGSGIGQAAAIKFAKEGARLALLGRSTGKIEETYRLIKDYGVDCVKLIADVSDNGEMKKQYEMIAGIWGSIDILFANAGINGLWSPIEDLPVEEWDRTLGINARGTFLTLKYAIPLMKEKGGAVIIDSSVNGTRCFTNRGASAYASSKAAQTAFGKMAALELAQYKIRVNVICPGATQTDIESHTCHSGEEKLTQWVNHPNGIIPLTGNVWGKAEQVADAVIFLAGDGASHITGTVLYVDGGSSLIM